jgi:anaerobic selenocysteine-containing dehydrogenase
MDRRKFLKTGTIATTALAIGSSSANATENKTDLKNIAPTSLEAEYTFSKSGDLIENPDFRTAFSRCFGCFNICGVRAKIDNKTGKVLRVSGNPYSPANQAGSPMDMNLAPKEAMKRLSALDDKGLSNRSTLCGRGNAVIDAMDDPHRITTCMKRTGKRGENKWKNISYEQLLKEVINGGDLFGEGKVEDLKISINLMF